MQLVLLVGTSSEWMGLLTSAGSNKVVAANLQFNPMKFHLQRHGVSVTCLWFGRGTQLTEVSGGERASSLDLEDPEQQQNVHSLLHGAPADMIIDFALFTCSSKFIITHYDGQPTSLCFSVWFCIMHNCKLKLPYSFSDTSLLQHLLQSLPIPYILETIASALSILILLFRLKINQHFTSDR